MLTLAALAVAAAVFYVGRLVERRRWNALMDWWTVAEMETLETIAAGYGAAPLPPAEQARAFLEQAATANVKPI